MCQLALGPEFKAAAIDAAMRAAWLGSGFFWFDCLLGSLAGRRLGPYLGQVSCAQLKCECFICEANLPTIAGGFQDVSVILITALDLRKCDLFPSCNLQIVYLRAQKCDDNRVVVFPPTFPIYVSRSQVAV